MTARLPFTEATARDRIVVETLEVRLQVAAMPAPTAATTTPRTRTAALATSGAVAARAADTADWTMAEAITVTLAPNPDTTEMAELTAPLTTALATAVTLSVLDAAAGGDDSEQNFETDIDIDVIEVELGRIFNNNFNNNTISPQVIGDIAPVIGNVIVRDNLLSIAEGLTITDLTDMIVVQALSGPFLNNFLNGDNLLAGGLLSGNCSGSTGPLSGCLNGLNGLLAGGILNGSDVVGGVLNENCGNSGFFAFGGCLNGLNGLLTRGILNSGNDGGLLNGSGDVLSNTVGGIGVGGILNENSDILNVLLGNAGNLITGPLLGASVVTQVMDVLNNSGEFLPVNVLATITEVLSENSDVLSDVTANSFITAILNDLTALVNIF